MKHFLHSGCLLRSLFEVELKMSSFLATRGMFQVGEGVWRETRGGMAEGRRAKKKIKNCNSDRERSDEEG